MFFVCLFVCFLFCLFFAYASLYMFVLFVWVVFLTYAPLYFFSYAPLYSVKEDEGLRSYASYNGLDTQSIGPRPRRGGGRGRRRERDEGCCSIRYSRPATFPPRVHDLKRSDICRILFLCSVYLCEPVGFMASLHSSSPCYGHVSRP